MPHVLSTRGPALAVGDVNGDGLDDFYVGGAKWQPGRLFVQQNDGTFRESEQPAIAADSLAGRRRRSLLRRQWRWPSAICSSSAAATSSGAGRRAPDRLYINDGHGNFHRERVTRCRDFARTASCVVAGDFNGDGHPDLFVGRRAVARKLRADSRTVILLQNDGTGHFTDVTGDKAPGSLPRRGW